VLVSNAMTSPTLDVRAECAGLLSAGQEPGYPLPQGLDGRGHLDVGAGGAQEQGRARQPFPSGPNGMLDAF
jgi:hypothetical protein